MTLDQLNIALTEWHRDKYGTAVPDMVRTALKGAEEMGEIAKAVLRVDRDNLEEELADVFFILLHLARGSGFDLMKIAGKKLCVIQDRLKKEKGKKK